MRRAIFAAWVAMALCAGPASAEIFKCVDEAGDVTFVNDASKCPNAVPHSLEGRVDRATSSATRAKEEQPDSGAASSPEKRLEWALLDASDVRPRWEVVNETVEDTAKDADLVEWGVVAKRARHYTRGSVGESQVCSVELWAFQNEARARLAHENFKFPDWRIDRKGDTLIMLRAVTVRGNAAKRTIFSDCEKLGNIVVTRADKFVKDE
jgi:hypothetical protein